MLKPNKIKGYRIMAGITQEDAAKYLDMDKKTYIKSENGARDFSIYEAKKLADLLQVSVDVLFFN